MQIINATIDDQRQLLEFLEARGLAENVWLIQSVSNDAYFNDETVGQICVCKDQNRIAGVSCIGWNSGRPGEKCMIRLAAEGEEAFHMLVNAFPESQSQDVIIMNTDAQHYMDCVPGYERTDEDVYFTINPEDLKPYTSSSDRIIEVTEETKYLLDGCENPPKWAHKGIEDRIDAYVRDDKVVSVVATGPISPALPSGQRPMYICALYTETEFRRRGYARELIFEVTQRILSEGNLPIYWTDYDNLASQALCKSLGYHYYAQDAFYCR